MNNGRNWVISESPILLFITHLFRLSQYIISATTSRGAQQRRQPQPLVNWSRKDAASETSDDLCITTLLCVEENVKCSASSCLRNSSLNRQRNCTTTTSHCQVRTVKVMVLQTMNWLSPDIHRSCSTRLTIRKIIGSIIFYKETVSGTRNYCILIVTVGQTLAKVPISQRRHHF